MLKEDAKLQKKELGRQLWLCRQERGLTLAEVSELLQGSLKPQTIERFEIGVVPLKDISVLNRLCRLYNKRLKVVLE